jgi:hypothetical protein
VSEFNIQTLAQLDKSRFSNYKSNLDFYEGRQWPAKSKNRQLVFNYARIAIDKVTSYLMNGLNFACDSLLISKSNFSGGPFENDESVKDMSQKAESVIYSVYEDNNLQQLDYETEVDCAILGDACYKVTWDVDNKKIRITSPDMNGIFAWWVGDDISKVWRVASRYTLSQDDVDILYKKTVSKKQVYMTEVWTARDFVLYLDNEIIEKKPNPYGFIPFIIFPNIRKPKSFWGISDVPPLKEAQMELNRALSQLSRILEVSGNPIAVLEGVESSEDIAVRPGAVWNIPPDTRAYLLDLLQGGGIRLHIDYIDMVYRCLHDISEAPRAAYGGVEKELSGVALEVELQSLLQKVLRKRAIRTSVYTERNRMILSLHSKFNSEDLTPVSHRIIWGQVLPADKAREAHNEQLLVQSGIHSRRTAMDQLGIKDPEAEFEKWIGERKTILEMNQQYRARSARNGERERSIPAEAEGAIEKDYLS